MAVLVMVSGKKRRMIDIERSDGLLLVRHPTLQACADDERRLSAHAPALFIFNGEL